MSSQTTDESLNERAQQLLKLLVEHYIRDGQPVGSRTLSRDLGLNLSAATIRNVMADLEELGFVTSPHTSAGRIPTDKGYRFFVDTLLKFQPLGGRQDRRRSRARLGEHADDPKALVAAASQMLSSVTRLAGVVTLPRQSHAALSQIEFVPLSDNRVLAILVVNGREVQNRILQLERHLQRRGAAARLELSEPGVRRQGAERGARAPARPAEGDARAPEPDDARCDPPGAAGGRRAGAGGGRMEYVIAGETNLMGFAELSNVEKLRRLFEAFTQQRDILHLLDQSLKAEGVQIFIGQESGYTILDDCSVVTAPYTLDQEVVGVLGVIGPTRMAYERVIPIVDITAKLLGSALNSRA